MNIAGDSPVNMLSNMSNNNSVPIGRAGGAGGNRGRGRGGGRGGRRRASAHQREQRDFIVVDETGNRVCNKFHQFLDEFEDESGDKYYESELTAMMEAESTTIKVLWNHLRSEMGIQSVYNDLADVIAEDYYRFEPYLRSAVQNFVRDKHPNYVHNDESRTGEDKEFYVSFYNFDSPSKLRELVTNRVGTLCSFSATVTRTTEVRPELVYGTFQCLECNNIMRDIPQQFKYCEPQICNNTDCQNRRSWNLDVTASKFVDWQKCRAQENSSDIPAGSMPRSIDVVVRNDSCEKCKPGDNALFTGTLIVVPDVGQFFSKAPTMIRNQGSGGGGGGPASGVSGLKALGVRELNYKLVFLANSVTQANQRFGHSDIRGDEDDEDLVIESMSTAEREDLLNMKNTPNLYERLASSIAPSIYGHEEIKRGILLMLFGGVVKTTKDNIKLRGDINICIIGDPSTAKSQFLMYVCRILPSRTIYTSGKASTSAGLTAAVIRDSETGEFGIEAGALMLADNGICCIDEFDKMDALDQAAIHEAMEQQTITITKAGIQATLNARASILAAANPVWGRYDTSKPMRYNVNITAPIMSRFDLFFVVLDECDEATDYHVACHIVNLHKTGGDERDIKTDFTKEQIQRYIRYARTIKPQIPEVSKSYFVRYYRQLRQSDQSDQKAYRFTVRQLESLIRLSEALARLHLDHEVKPNYVREAARLLKQSIINVDSQDIQLYTNDDDMEEDAKNDGAEDGDQKADADNDESKPKSISIAYDVYSKTANSVVSVIRRNEDDLEAGLKQSQIENLILKEKDSEMIGEEDIEYELQILRFIIHRLVTTDHILLIKIESEDDNVQNRVLMVHPNYDPDSRNTTQLKEIFPEVDEDVADAEAQQNSNNKKQKKSKKSNPKKAEMKSPSKAIAEN